MTSSLTLACVVELWPPVCAPTLGRAVEDQPQRPHEIDVPHVLAGLRADEEQLAAPEVVDLSVAAGGDRSHRHFFARGRLRLVGTGGGVVWGKEQNRSALRGHSLDLPAKVDLGLQELVARPAVLVRLAGKAHLVQRFLYFGCHLA